jgi:hypothetical protein
MRRAVCLRREKRTTDFMYTYNIFVAHHTQFSRGWRAAGQLMMGDHAPNNLDAFKRQFEQRGGRRFAAASLDGGQPFGPALEHEATVAPRRSRISRRCATTMAFTSTP